MVEEMKFEESSLAGYLVNNLKPLTKADPVILSEYVVALLKKDKSTEELQKLCADNLVEFLGQNAKSFTTKLFQALEDGSIVRTETERDLGGVKKLEHPQPAITVETYEQKSPPKENNYSNSSEPTSDPEDKEVSDDDDRNHKHRKREPRQHSLDNDVQDQSVRRYNRKRQKPYDNGQVFLEPDPQTSGSQKDANPTQERNALFKLDNRCSVSGPLLRAPIDFGPRARLGQPFRSDSSARFDLSTYVGRPPIGRGRGRSTVSWSPHDSRFSPLDPLDYASWMASRGPGHPGLFGGTGLPSGAGAQNRSWGGFGFIPGMSNGILDPLQPLGLRGTLRPTMTPPLNLGMPRQRCRDFEERGFCLRGDMCPMEHGLNRIVVEDVQSLSQFNLPVSIPNSHSLGVQAVSGPSTTAPAPSSLLTNNKAVPSKNSKSEVVDDAIKLNGASSTSGGDDADVYDPDQPLWNTVHPKTSTDLLMSSSNIGEEALWNSDASARRYVLSDGIESDVQGRNATGNMGSKSKSSAIWGRINSKFKSDSGSRINHDMISTGYQGNEMKEDHEEAIAHPSSNLSNRVSSVETGSKVTAILPGHRSFTDPGHRTGRPLSKASRTIFVNGIPQKDNGMDALFSHFKKFGKVIHIHIPQNSEKAFVQFNKREEAEAALKSPDAVMGNRFIKLAWANRDRNPDEMHNRDRLPHEQQSSAHTKSVHPPTSVEISLSSQKLVGDGGKGTLAFSAEKRSNAVNTPTAETLVSASGHPKALLTNVLTTVETPVSGHPKALLSNAPIVGPPVLKKVENLELLEEIRKKQELLDKKRDEFRRQLNKLEKQAISVKKGDNVSEQAVKRHKTEVRNEAIKAATLGNSYSSQICQDAEKTLQKRNSEGVYFSPSLKANSTTLQKSWKSINQTSSVPPPQLNRFKLDNRSTSFRVLPPLPADFANVAVLKDHFSTFGVISSVVLEPEGHKPSDNCSACISFATRHSAERAYQNGKIWEGHNLRFMWLTVAPNSSSEFGVRETSTPKADQKAQLQADSPAYVSKPSSTVKSALISQVDAVRNEEPNVDVEITNYVSESTSGLISEAASVRNDESNMDAESTNDVADLCQLVPPLPSSHSATMPLGKKCPEESDAPIVEGSVDVTL